MQTTYGVEEPFLPAPTGYHEVDNHLARPQQRRGDTEIYWVTGAGNVLMLFFVGQRLYTKVAFSKGLSLDDGLLILAWLASIVVQGVIANSFSSGVAGVHISEMTLEKYESSQLAVYVTTLLHLFCAAAAKLSLTVFYLRLSPLKWYRRATWATMGIVGVYSIIMICCVAFACTPVAGFWRAYGGKGRCLDKRALYTASASMNTLTDIMLLALPIPMVYGLQMPIKRRLVALGVSAAGLLSIEVNLFVICPSMLTLYEFFHETKRRWDGNRSRRLSLESLPVTSLSTASTLTLKSSSTYIITTIDCGVPKSKDAKPQPEQDDHPRKKNKWHFFGGNASNDLRDDRSDPTSFQQQGLNGRNGSQVSIGLCDEADVKTMQRSASKLSMRSGREGDGEKGILMTTTVEVKHESGP
ncbi:hypothetical protein PG996_004717 [Apiospora saccharicola]|uniref:Rhodopsin domain-containing protein n=1 Tax=Apiospora saccharicola TaxID=335842 RepID=A0ABR1W666_9PEZI